MYHCYTVTRVVIYMATNPVRVPESVHTEVQTASRMLGCSTSELMERAWEAFRQSPGFIEEFEFARKAFSVGDLEAVANSLHVQGKNRARERAAAVLALRD